MILAQSLDGQLAFFMIQKICRHNGRRHEEKHASSKYDGDTAGTESQDLPA